MNSKFIKVSLLASASVVLFITGCGPQDMDNAQINSDLGAEQAMAPQGADQGMAPQGGPQAEGGCPSGQCPAAAAAGGAGGCPSGNCEIAPDPDTARRVQFPDQVRTEQTKVTPTQEQQQATDIVDHYQTEHVYQPSERHHLVTKNRHLLNRYHKKVVLHPTMRRINRVVHTTTSSSETTPTEVVVAPTVDYGCANAAEPEPAPAPVVVQPVVRPVYYVQPVLSYFRSFQYY